ncbi:serine threonine kinase fungal-specific transcription factor [Pyrenophora teres f. teres]|uniref:Serine threonine kinase fungal-specific transcription factor n=1 Tax=Pyrenophora teres f. teres TaxID=97479 RepID=A0A6S6VVQ7_9PLEO|nr:serine threonine kinase fungal-specific transcription factor [Pyrenophora teres f. teres]
MTGENAPRLTGAATAYPHPSPRQPSSPVQQQQQHHHHHHQQHQQQPHHHQSPLAQLSPSTVKASPQQTPGPLDVIGGSAEPSAKRGMRSQIACARCRRSKTKCVNAGQGTTCEACANTKRDCIWDHAAAATITGPLRRDSTADPDAPPKKRRKLLAPTAAPTQRPVEGLGTYEDALQSPLLTAQVWEELFVIYEKHFSIDFPFLHKRTFLSAVQQQLPSANFSDTKPPAQTQAPKPYPPLLLAFLTQTARFHDKLVQHGQDAIKTAEFYAQATRTQMGTDIFGLPSLEKIQTLLLLGYYEWTALQGVEGWIKIGIAIRCAIVLGYPHLDVDHKGQPIPLRKDEGHLSEKDQVILRETQRRTFWSCCLMDSYLSWGENRPPMLRPEHFQRTQLVCSDEAFNYGRKARTRLLGEDDAAYARRRKAWDEHAKNANGDRDGSHQSDNGRWEIGEHEAELTWYIKVVVVFGEIVWWSCNSGRRQEGKTPPWNPTTTFKKLEDKLKRLKRDLPNDLQLTPDNTEDRVFTNPGKYVSIHAMYTLCFIWLYREYMPTSPWALARPVGPLDEPIIEDTPPEPDYWINQARDCAKACSDFTNLLHKIGFPKARSNPVQTPMVAFACFAVGICTIYCHYFPSMDPDSVISSRLEPRAHDVANSFLLHILDRFKMARSWICQLAEWQRYYREERKKYKEFGGNVDDSPKTNSSDGHGSGGLKDYTTFFEKMHKQFGNTTSDDSHWVTKEADLADTRLPHDEDSAERTLPPIAAAIKQEKERASDGRPNQHSVAPSNFTAVNQQPQPQPPVVAAYGPHVSAHNSYNDNSNPQYSVQRPSPSSYQNNYTVAMTPERNSFGPQFQPPPPSVPVNTTYQGQGWMQPVEMNAARTAMEHIGQETINNWNTFDPLMSATPGQYPNMSWDAMNYDDNSNTPFYAPGAASNYANHQQQ